MDVIPAEKLTAIESDDDLLWGWQQIGAYIKRTPAQAQYMHKVGLFNGAIRKLSPKLTVGSKQALRRAMLGQS